MIKSMFGALAAAMLLAAAAPASAQDDNDWTFTVVNLSDQAIVLLTMAYPHGEMSDDLLPGQIIEGGEQLDMEFPPEDEECDYWVYATLADGTEVSAALSLCGVDGIYVSDDDLDVF